MSTFNLHILKLTFICSLVFTSLSCGEAWAQISAENPGEWLALEEGNNMINDTIHSEIKGQKATAALQIAIAGEFTMMKSWQSKYNSYLKSVNGYASSLKAATHLYNDGVSIFFTLVKIKNAIKNNPQGVVATLSMNNLYLETATEFVSVYNLLKDAVAQGGSENMLTGSERSKTLWELNDKLSSLSKKLHALHLSIRYYKMTDVWNNATAGIIDKDISTIADAAKDRWTRAAAVTGK